MERGNQPVSPAEAASLLQWWNDAGVDCLVGEAAHDWLRASPHLVRTTLAPLRTTENVADAPAPALPDQLELFHAFLANDAALPFHVPAAPRVLPSGNPTSGLMLVTDVPGIEDCDSGMLISGEAGQLLDRMLAAIGRDRSTTYIASLSCFRTTAGSFTAAAAAQCAEIARHHIGLVAPKAVLLLGDTVSKALLGMSTIQARGKWYEIETQNGQFAAMASFPPSYLLDQPGAKRHAWADLQRLAERLGA